MKKPDARKWRLENWYETIIWIDKYQRAGSLIVEGYYRKKTLASKAVRGKSLGGRNGIVTKVRV